MHISKMDENIVFKEEDLPYEEEILRNPYSVKCWLRYVEHKKEGPKVNLIYERALKELPGSYKLWYNYLRLRRQQLKGRCITDPRYEDVNNTFERALVFMHKMPRIWVDYCALLTAQQKITRTRKVFDRALRALPISQHGRVWPLYLRLVRSHGVPETAVRVYRRHLKLSPENAEEYIEYLVGIGRLDEAAVRLARVVNNEAFVSRAGKSNHQLWQELCDLICKNPDKVKSLKVEAIIRQGLRRFSDQVGRLWCSLSDYYIRSGHFEKARDVFEEAVQTVMTVRDFTQVFDAYAQFEESVISARMEATSDAAADDEEEELELEVLMARFEDLMDRRPLLLNSVLLRQNPHSVHEWHKRVKLFDGRPRETVGTYTEAVSTVDPKLATGKLHTLWVEFAKFYEANAQVDDARAIFRRAADVPYRKVDELAAVWCEFAEMEIRQENYDEALRLMTRATAAPARRAAYHDDSETVQARLYRSLKLWSMYADLEESFGTFKSCKAVYDRIVDLKIATPQIIMNYALFLEEHDYFEEAFKAYEKGIALFKWPYVFDIWNTYLAKFIERYGGRKLERVRDLFEQCLDGCPPKFAKSLYLLYAKLEEEYGLARHAMAIYDRASRAVLPLEQYEMFNIYIKKAAELYGVTHTREIYEKAVDVLSDEPAREMCLRFADLECKLGEIDRARSIYSHASQICDPRVAPKFWQTWKEFEVRHGNEDTVREMLRIKRSVQAVYNTQVNFMSAQMLAASGSQATVADLSIGGGVGQDMNDMRMLEQRAATLAAESLKDQPKKPDKGIMFVRGERAAEEEMVEAVKHANPDEIQLDEEFESDEEETVKEVEVPSAVFGELRKEENDGEEGEGDAGQDN
ncbi:PREDICTED: pre-mRNA-splicing factor SYF1-like [Priapulus caudatus]|uniref:Pre-mRNA-splicing factor SYF1-like n=1 Tax=Priapulus caudatus TaxID=37621 RepID=A0ABM1DU92_PRICU|nr:PREDICTED: pre-mRNA-splicing factor SYF1-like [Priapulus caudatus]